MSASATDASDEMTPGERMDQRQRMVLYMLIQDPFPWTIDELGREFGDRGDISDAVAELVTEGLVHRFGEFVIPTRTARRADELYQGAI
jgi:hypothetical protein